MWQDLFVTGKIWLLLTTLLFLPGIAGAQTEDSEKEIAVVEVGAAASQSLNDSGFSGGPTVAVEVTPIENRLELETGITAFLLLIRPNGTPTFYSRSLGRCPAK